MPRPLDRTSPQLTLRAILTGMTLGALLSACNVYTGLKIGWGLNMSITAALLSYGFWNALHGLSGGTRAQMGILSRTTSTRPRVRPVRRYLRGPGSRRYRRWR